MPRPSQNTDQQLIAAAKNMLKTSGISQINLRQVAKKAKVNLGMFHYHFKTKEAFTRRVLQEVYDQFFQEFTLESSKGEPLEQLRGALLTFGKFVMTHRRMVLGILHDVLNKDRVMLDFVKANGARHGKVIVGLVRDCQKKGSLKKAPLTSVMPLLMGTVAAPALMLAVMEHLEIKIIRFLPIRIIEKELGSEKAIENRVDLALSSLAVKGKS